MTLISRTLLASAAVAGLASSAWAHPGHATELVSANNGWHYVLQPEHGVLLAAVIAVVARVLVVAARQRRRMKLVPIPVRRKR